MYSNAGIAQTQRGISCIRHCDKRLRPRIATLDSYRSLCKAELIAFVVKYMYGVGAVSTVFENCPMTRGLKG